MGTGRTLVLADRRADEPTRIRRRHEHLLLDVAHADVPSYRDIVEVRGVDTPARLAETYERMILHEEGRFGHAYRVAEDGVLYVYRVPPTDDDPPARDRHASPAAPAPAADAPDWRAAVDDAAPGRRPGRVRAWARVRHGQAPRGDHRRAV